MRNRIKLIIIAIIGCVFFSQASELGECVFLNDLSSVKTTNYYISNSVGDDANNGLAKENPWKTLDKISSSTFAPGDSILFMSGDEFVGNLSLNSSGLEDYPIVLSAYGTGEKPILNGSTAEGGDHISAISIINQDFIEIENLEIRNNRQVSREGVADHEGAGIRIWNTGDRVLKHFALKDLTIRNVYPITTEGLEFNAIKNAGIHIKTYKNKESGKEKNIQDVLVENCYFEHNCRFGIFSQHGGGAVGVGNDSINRNMNFVFRNNHFFENGGSGITPGRTYNCLLENNVFEYCGSDYDPRMPARGSGAWFWNCRNVIAQYNKSLHIRGGGDSYGMHIDFGNRNVIFQYNYSEDSEGGFVEILGKNVNSVYRFNVSVNDGFRDHHGYSLWVSTYAGQGNRIASDSNYIYNNTIYMDAEISPDIHIEGGNTFVYNNIFCALGNSILGASTNLINETGTATKISNNLFFGNVMPFFTNYSENSITDNPLFLEPGILNVEGYKLKEQSPALNSGLSFPEPYFPMAGKGIFKHIKLTPDTDLYGNPVNVAETVPHIGAYNGGALIVDYVKRNSNTVGFNVYPNPAKTQLNVSLKEADKQIEDIFIMDNSGRVLIKQNNIAYENSIVCIDVSDLLSGIYFIKINSKLTSEIQSFVKQ